MNAISIFVLMRSFVLNNANIINVRFCSYSTVTDLAKFLGLSTSNPFSLEIK